jgi:hypothetical protein
MAVAIFKDILLSSAINMKQSKHEKVILLIECKYQNVHSTRHAFFIDSLNLNIDSFQKVRVARVATVVHSLS